jgi:hypothetical protein
MLLLLPLLLAVTLTLPGATARRAILESQSLAHAELSSIDKDDNYLYAKCNNEPVLSKASLIKNAPVRTELRPEATFQVFRNITGYRFTNPAGVTYDGITTHAEGLLGTVSMVPAVPIQDHTWFEGYSWRVVYVNGCENFSDGHIGWAFFCSDESCMGESRSASVAQVSEPDFIFFIVWSTTTATDSDVAKKGEGKRQPLLLTGNRMRNLTSINAF